MNLYNRELQDGYILSRIKLYREAATYAPALIKVFNSFDGKVFNCKLEKALQEAIPNKYIHVRKEYTFSKFYSL